jgi:carbon-monoxide dehydrogenase medium subunit
VAVALDAKLAVRSAGGERVVPAGEFFVTHLTTCMAPNEMLIEVQIPALRGPAGTAFVEYARRHGDFAIAGVAAVVSLDEDRRCRGARLALSGVADRPLDVSSAAAGLVGRVIGDHEVREVGEQIAASLEPPGDIHASPEFRRRVSAVMIGRALLAAAREAQAKL